ncbi:MAG: ATP-binding protein [Maribacter arcticus]|uniref:tetratricopeptide repeat-containing sensor histidine kinase n=1 Tax=Maribacter arcticus TaxID=561365 RepID=UPI003001D941
MSIKYFLRILLLIILPALSMAQDQVSKLDSLHIALKNSPSDTLRMFALDDIASYHAESDRDSSMYYCEASIELAKKLKQPIHLANFLLLKSYLVQKQSDFTQSYRLCNEALTIFEDDGNDKSAIIPKDWAIEPARLRKSYSSNVYHQLGNTMVGAGNLQKAIEYFKKAVQINEELNPLGGGMTSNMNIGSSYFKLGQMDSALIYSKKAVIIANNGGWKAYLGSALRDVGLVYMKKTELDSAKHYFNWALKANKQQNNLPTEIGIRNTLADFYKQQNQVDSMYYYASTALDLGYKLESDGFIASSAERVAKAWERKENTDSAYVYLAISKKLGDSINIARREKSLQFQNENFEEQLRLEQEAQDSEAAKNKIKTTALLVGLGLLSVLVIVFYRNNRQRKSANTILEQAYDNLKATQSQLIQSEKMASLGELTAGIAHEIQNPLNFVNNFSEVNNELIDEMNEELDKGDLEEAKAISLDIKQNLEKINHHGKRADNIVKGMLQHSRSSSGTKEPTDINALADEYLRLAYHGLRAKDKSFNAELITDFDKTIGKVNVIPQDMGRVILNLITNAFYAVNEKKQQEKDFKPSVSVTTKKMGGHVEIKVTDNGNGIPKKVLDKIFQPFFTTKPTGQGTGLGLSMSYDIVTKGHGGDFRVDSTVGKGTEMILSLPIEVKNHENH